MHDDWIQIRSCIMHKYETDSQRARLASRQRAAGRISFRQQPIRLFGTHGMQTRLHSTAMGKAMPLSSWRIEMKSCTSGC